MHTTLQEPSSQVSSNDDSTSENKRRQSSRPLDEGNESSRNDSSGVTESSSRCSCNESLMDVVQKLDDDFFSLRHLPFDEVLHVQKWLMFSCCEPLDCAYCEERPITHSTLLIICDRITQIFTCLCRRLGSITTPPIGPDPPPTESWPLQQTQEVIVAWQLFDGRTGQSGMTGPCTHDIFRETFGAVHSQEEQLLTIQVLMKAQMRNFTKLLERVGDMSPCKSSQARAGRVKNLITHLTHLESVLESIAKD